MPTARLYASLIISSLGIYGSSAVVDKAERPVASMASPFCATWPAKATCLGRLRPSGIALLTSLRSMSFAFLGIYGSFAVVDRAALNLGTSRGGDSYYFVTVTYFKDRVKSLYDDEI